MASSAGFISINANRKVRKLLGRAYLRENRINEALEVYLGILKDHPGDADVLVILGNLYQLSGSPVTAERLYRRVLEAIPDDPLVEKQLLAARELPCQEWEVSDPLSDEAISALVSHLQAKNTPDQVEEIRTSADMPERVTSEDWQDESNGNGHPAPPSGKQGQAPQDHLPENHLTEDIQQLMPALIAQNIRQARAAGFIELAQALQSLQINLARQVEDRWADDLLKDEEPVEKSLDE